jgi:hypothetical protein
MSNRLLCFKHQHAGRSSLLLRWSLTGYMGGSPLFFRRWCQTLECSPWCLRCLWRRSFWQRQAQRMSTLCTAKVNGSAANRGSDYPTRGLQQGFSNAAGNTTHTALLASCTIQPRDILQHPYCCPDTSSTCILHKSRTLTVCDESQSPVRNRLHAQSAVGEEGTAAPI